MSDDLRLWFWTITDEITKRRRRTRYKMTERDALERFGDYAVTVKGSLEIRRVTGGHTSDFLRH